MQYQVFENVRNYSKGRAGRYCNIYTTEKYMAVVPIGKKWPSVVQIILAILLLINAINFDINGSILWFILLLVFVGIDYALRYSKINKLKGASWEHITKQDGFASEKSSIKIIDSGRVTFEFGNNDQISITNDVAKDITES